jgi:hypothetical protein
MPTIQRRVILGVSLQKLHEALIIFFPQSLYKYYRTKSKNTRNFSSFINFCISSIFHRRIVSEKRSLHEGLPSHTISWNKITEPYIADLHMRPADLLDRQKLYLGLKTTMEPLYALAASQGFPKDWQWKSPLQKTVADGQLESTR